MEIWSVMAFFIVGTVLILGLIGLVISGWTGVEQHLLMSALPHTRIELHGFQELSGQLSERALLT